MLAASATASEPSALHLLQALHCAASGKETAAMELHGISGGAAALRAQLASAASSSDDVRISLELWCLRCELMLGVGEQEDRATRAAEKKLRRWLASVGTESRDTATCGAGLFALRSFPAGAVVYASAAYYYTPPGDDAMSFRQLLAALEAAGAHANLAYVDQLDADAFVGPTHDDDVADFTSAGDRLNHSCEPSCWLSGDHVVTARRDVLVGEELTIDYGSILLLSTEQQEALQHALPPGGGAPLMPSSCLCGAARCRRQVRADVDADTD